MIYLFIHQNFPGQYKHLVSHLASDPNNRVIFITQAARAAVEGIELIVYDPLHPEGLNCHPYTVDIDRSIRAGLAVASACRELSSRGVRPDIICGHNGWGEMLFVKDVFPDVPALAYFEFYYHASDVDVGFDPEFTRGVDPFRLRTRNAVNLLGFDAVDWGNAPTKWQRQVHPPEFRSRITVIHEGIDTTLVRPDEGAWIYLEQDGVLLNRSQEVVTYVARNLEPYRGFHSFMRAAAEILHRRPNAHVVVVGGDEVSYGTTPADGVSYREAMLLELGSRLDLSRVHFLGRISYDSYIRLLQISSAHVYLTYPFVLSWSFLEAMACGCAMVGSDTPPVTEVLRDGENGLLVDFFSPQDIADKVDAVLDDPARTLSLRQAARKTVVEKFDLRARQLPLWTRLFEDLITGRRPNLNIDEG